MGMLLWPQYKEQSGKAKNAFIFLEVVIAVSIMGIILGMAAPALQGPFERFRVITSARQLESDMRNLQQEAISLEDSGYKILFSNTFYQISRDNIPIKTVNLPAGVTIAFNNFPSSQLNFNLKGLPLNNGHVKFYGETTGEIRYVIVYALTGRIRIDTLPPS